MPKKIQNKLAKLSDLKAENKEPELIEIKSDSSERLSDILTCLEIQKNVIAAKMT